MAIALDAAPAHADDCAGRSVSTVHGGRWAWVELRWSSDRWEVRTTKTAGAIGAWMPVPGPEGRDEHAHLVVFAPADHRFFAIIDTAADHEAERRIRAYDADGALVKVWGLADFMTPAELAQVSRSISHLHWLEPESATPPLDASGNTLRLRLVGGRDVGLALGGDRPDLR